MAEQYSKHLIGKTLSHRVEAVVTDGVIYNTKALEVASYIKAHATSTRQYKISKKIDGNARSITTTRYILEGTTHQLQFEIKENGFKLLSKKINIIEYSNEKNSGYKPTIKSYEIK